MRMQIVTVVLAVVLHIPQAFSVTGDIRFDRFSVQDGLSDNTVTSIIRDSTGFMWFGTMNGLNRFDGYQYVTYKHNPADSTSLSDNLVISLFEDSNGVLWIGTNSGGLNRFDYETGTFKRYMNAPDNPESISSNCIYSIAEGLDGIIWAGTLYGLNALDPERGVFKRYFHDPADSTSISNSNTGSVYADTNGDIWIGSNEGLNVIEHTTGRITRLPDTNEKTSLLNQNIIDIVEGEDESLWLSTWGGGLRKFNKLTREYTVFLHDPKNPDTLNSDIVGHMAIDHNGVLWFGTTAGLHSIDTRNGAIRSYLHDPGDPFSMSTNLIWGVYVDTAGILWVGSLYSGGVKMVPSKSVFRLFRCEDICKETSRGGYIDEICEHGTTIWLGSNVGLHRYDVEASTFTTHLYTDMQTPVTGNLELRTLFNDNSENLWLGTSLKGLVRFHIDTGRFTQLMPDIHALSVPALEVNAINKDSEGLFWLGTNIGIMTYDQASGTFDKLLTDDTLVNLTGISSIVFDPDGVRVWLSGEQGVVLYNRKTGEQRSIFDNNKNMDLRGKFIFCMMDDGQGSLWLGTADGLYSYDKDMNTSTRFNLANDSVYNIIQDRSGDIWVCTSAGLSSVDIQTGNVLNIGVDDGLPIVMQGNRSLLCAKDGAIYVGGLNGFFTFHPENVFVNTEPPPIVITSVKIDNEEALFGKEISTLREISIPHVQSPLTFEFSALDYTNSRSNAYAYKIDQLNSDWIQSGNEHKVTYSNLDPGTYVFRVKGANSHGIWNDAGVSLTLTIIPPFWKTLWFRGLLFVALAGMVLSAHYIRIVAIRRKNVLLQILVDQRSEELRTINAKLAELAVTDELTQISNRRSFNEYLDSQWKIAVRENKPMSLIFADIDHFKYYNDYYGHQKGDECLYRVAQIMKNTIRRPKDFIARYGGEEFAVILPDTREEGAEYIANDIIAGIVNAAIPHEKSDIVSYVTVSLGITTVYPDQNTRPERLVKMADEALYEAKKQGRNRCVVFRNSQAS